jgi:hypothetical protein
MHTQSFGKLRGGNFLSPGMDFEYPGFFPPDKDEGRNAHLNRCRSKARFPKYNVLSSVAEVENDGYARGV